MDELKTLTPELFVKAAPTVAVPVPANAQMPFSITNTNEVKALPRISLDNFFDPVNKDYAEGSVHHLSVSFFFYLCLASLALSMPLMFVFSFRQTTVYHDGCCPAMDQQIHRWSFGVVHGLDALEFS
jgi:hypothetical protein